MITQALTLISLFQSLVEATAPIVIPITNENGVIAGNIGLGTPEHSIHVQFDTGSYLLAVNSPSKCSSLSCSNYAYNASTSAGPRDSNSFNIGYSDGSGGEGHGLSDILTIGDEKIDYRFISLDASPIDINIFGLGPYPAGQNVSLLPTLVSDGKISSQVYNFYSDGLVIGGVDTSKYSGTLEKVPLSLDRVGAAYAIVDSISTSCSQLTDNVYSAMLDTGAQFLGFPTDLFNAIFQSFGGKIASGQIGDLDGHYAFKCKNSHPLTFSFGGKDITVPVSDFTFQLISNGVTIADSDGDQLCSALIMDTGSEVVLGAPFFKSSYVVLDYDRSELAVASAADNGSHVVEATDSIPNAVKATGYDNTATKSTSISYTNPATITVTDSSIETESVYSGAVAQCATISSSTSSATASSSTSGVTTLHVSATMYQTSYYCPACVTESSANAVSTSSSMLTTVHQTGFIYTISYYCPTCVTESSGASVPTTGHEVTKTISTCTQCTTALMLGSSTISVPYSLSTTSVSSELSSSAVTLSSEIPSSTTEAFSSSCSAFSSSLVPSSSSTVITTSPSSSGSVNSSSAVSSSAETDSSSIIGSILSSKSSSLTTGSSDDIVTAVVITTSNSMITIYTTTCPLSALATATVGVLSEVETTTPVITTESEPISTSVDTTRTSIFVTAVKDVSTTVKTTTNATEKPTRTPVLENQSSTATLAGYPSTFFTGDSTFATNIQITVTVPSTIITSSSTFSSFPDISTFEGGAVGSSAVVGLQFGLGLVGLLLAL